MCPASALLSLIGKRSPGQRGYGVIRALVKVFGWPEFKSVEKPIAQINKDVFSEYEGNYRYTDWPDYGVQILKDGDNS